MNMSSAYVTSSPAQGTVQPAEKATKGNDRPLAALLLAAAVAALAVAVDHLVGTWADDHLLAAWVAMWAVVFAGSLVLAGTARRLASNVMTHLDGWAQSRAQARADARFLQLARRDSRVMADLQAAQDRSQQTSIAMAPQQPAQQPTPAQAVRQESPLSPLVEALIDDAAAEAAKRWYSRYRNTFYI